MEGWGGGEGGGVGGGGNKSYVYMNVHLCMHLSILTMHCVRVCTGHSCHGLCSAEHDVIEQNTISGCLSCVGGIIYAYIFYL